MNEEKYNERVMQMSAYCALQARLLELYNPEYNDEVMLREISPVASKAIISKKEKNLISLENLSKSLEERISEFERQKPDILNSPEVGEVIELLGERKRDYEELNRDS
ncbi:MAG: hypothetical protein KJ767_01665 [Nanoarchaeota archaeon]|nr:hypothetical protein [Nanoarchaeota archaeon]